MASLVFVLGTIFACAQAKEEKKETVPQFEMVRSIKHTPVKDQAQSGTCWSFGAASFVEAELLRMGKEEFDLSEMFVVKQVYAKKGTHYVRYRGKTNFGEGSLAWDFFQALSEQGIVPEVVFSGKNIGEERHDHSEMASLLTAMLKALEGRRKLTPRWKEAYEAVLTAYLGKAPEEFEYQGKKYTPRSFFETLGFSPSDYVELTSFTHHPFYTRIPLEIPDNWARHSHYYNLPLDEMEQVLEYALQNGYSVLWDGDVSEKGFHNKEGYAVVPVDKKEEEKEEKKSEKKEELVEKEISQEMRQETFDNYTTSDDHLMHIVGQALHPNKTPFYQAKNSWGVKNGQKGYIFLSRAYVRLKTISIAVHKDAIPKAIKEKFGM